MLGRTAALVKSMRFSARPFLSTSSSCVGSSFGPFSLGSTTHSATPEHYFGLLSARPCCPSFTLPSQPARFMSQLPNQDPAKVSAERAALGPLGRLPEENKDPLKQDLSQQLRENTKRNLELRDFLEKMNEERKQQIANITEDTPIQNVLEIVQGVFELAGLRRLSKQDRKLSRTRNSKPFLDQTIGRDEVFLRVADLIFGPDDHPLSDGSTKTMALIGRKGTGLTHVSDEIPSISEHAKRIISQKLADGSTIFPIDIQGKPFKKERLLELQHILDSNPDSNFHVINITLNSSTDFKWTNEKDAKSIIVGRLIHRHFCPDSLFSYSLETPIVTQLVSKLSPSQILEVIRLDLQEEGKNSPKLVIVLDEISNIGNEEIRKEVAKIFASIPKDLHKRGATQSTICIFTTPTIKGLFLDKETEEGLERIEFAPFDDSIRVDLQKKYPELDNAPLDFLLMIAQGNWKVLRNSVHQYLNSVRRKEDKLSAAHTAFQDYTSFCTFRDDRLTGTVLSKIVKHTITNTPLQVTDPKEIIMLDWFLYRSLLLNKQPAESFNEVPVFSVIGSLFFFTNYRVMRRDWPHFITTSRLFCAASCLFPSHKPQDLGNVFLDFFWLRCFVLSHSPFDYTNSAFSNAITHETTLSYLLPGFHLLSPPDRSDLTIRIVSGRLRNEPDIDVNSFDQEDDEVMPGDLVVLKTIKQFEGMSMMLVKTESRINLILVDTSNPSLSSVSGPTNKKKSEVSRRITDIKTMFDPKKRGFFRLTKMKIPWEDVIIVIPSNNDLSSSSSSPSSSVAGSQQILEDLRQEKTIKKFPGRIFFADKDTLRKFYGPTVGSSPLFSSNKLL